MYPNGKLPRQGTAEAWLVWCGGGGGEVNNDIKTRLLRVFVLPE